MIYTFLGGLSGAAIAIAIVTVLDMIPMGRLGQPDELAPLAVYLASEASGYMTGATLVIGADGA